MSSVLVLTGPPGVGKTTVARLVADALPRSVHLEADTFWRFIRSGRVPPWLPEAHEQNEVVVQAVARTAVQFAAGGFDVVGHGLSDEYAIRRMHAEFASAVPDEQLILDAGSRTASDVAEQVLQVWRTGTNLVT